MTGHITVECPHCYTRVLPMANNICPACKMDMSNTQDVDPDKASLIVYESQELPPYCYLCNSYTERYVLLEGDKESALNRSIRLLGSLFVPHRVHQTDEGTTNVFIHLPQCESCAQLEEPTPMYVDYDEQSMTFVVNKSFRERVRPTTVEEELSDPDESDTEENLE